MGWKEYRDSVKKNLRIIENKQKERLRELSKKYKEVKKKFEDILKW